MKPVFSRQKKSPDDFHLVDLLYIPSTVQDWFILILLVAIFVASSLVFFEWAKYNREVISQQIQYNSSREITALKHLTSATFLQYLTGFWQVGNTTDFVKIAFSSPTEGSITVPLKSGLKVIPITVVSDSPPLGILTFVTKDNQKGTIKKIWDRDALVVTLPGGNPHTVYYMLSSPSHR